MEHFNKIYAIRNVCLKFRTELNTINVCILYLSDGIGYYFSFPEHATREDEMIPAGKPVECWRLHCIITYWAQQTEFLMIEKKLVAFTLGKAK